MKEDVDGGGVAKMITEYGEGHYEGPAVGMLMEEAQALDRKSPSPSPNTS